MRRCHRGRRARGRCRAIRPGDAGGIQVARPQLVVAEVAQQRRHLVPVTGLAAEPQGFGLIAAAPAGSPATLETNARVESRKAVRWDCPEAAGQAKAFLDQRHRCARCPWRARTQAPICNRSATRSSSRRRGQCPVPPRSSPRRSHSRPSAAGGWPRVASARARGSVASLPLGRSSSASSASAPSAACPRARQYTRSGAASRKPGSGSASVRLKAIAARRLPSSASSRSSQAPDRLR